LKKILSRTSKNLARTSKNLSRTSKNLSRMNFKKYLYYNFAKILKESK